MQKLNFNLESRINNGELTPAPKKCNRNEMVH